MKVKVSEASGHVLDWMVAVAEFGYGADSKTNKYCTNWAFGGPILERDNIGTTPMTTKVGDERGTRYWFANHEDKTDFQDGPTPLIAGLRCYVASKLGDEVDVPDELGESK